MKPNIKLLSIALAHCVAFAVIFNFQDLSFGSALHLVRHHTIAAASSKHCNNYGNEFNNSSQANSKLTYVMKLLNKYASVKMPNKLARIFGGVNNSILGSASYNHQMLAKYLRDAPPEVAALNANSAVAENSFLQEATTLLQNKSLVPALLGITHRVQQDLQAILNGANSNCKKHALMIIAQNATSMDALQALVANNNKLPNKVIAAVASNPLANSQLLHSIASENRNDPNTALKVVANPNTTTASLKLLAASTNDKAVLQKIISDPVVDPDTLIAVIQNPITSPELLDNIARLTHASLSTDTALVNNIQTAPETLQIIAARTKSAALLNKIAQDQLIDTNGLITLAQNSAIDNASLQAILKQPAYIVSKNVLAMLAANPNASARVLASIADHPNADLDIYESIIQHPNVSARILAKFQQKSYTPAVQELLAEKKSEFDEFFDNQQQNLSTVQNVVAPVAATNTTPRIYAGVALQENTVDLQQDYGNKRFAKNMPGFNVFAGCYLNDRLFTECGYQCTSTNKKEINVRPGENLPGNKAVDPLHGYYATSSVKTHLPYLGLGINMPCPKCPKHNVSATIGAAFLKYRAQYQLISGYNLDGTAMAPFNAADQETYTYVCNKQKIVPMMKLGWRYQCTQNWGALLSASLFNTKNVAAKSGPIELRLQNSYNLGLGLWYGF